ncbi:MAG: PAS domain-containing protein [Bacteroidota bacterium]
MSPRLDEVDAFISGVNMLGEELKERTISRDYFNDIFNSVSDMVFVLDKQGKIENINTAVIQHLQYSLDFLTGKPMSFLSDKEQPAWFGKILKDIRASRMTSYETVFRTKDKNSIPVLLSASLLIGNKKEKGKSIDDGQRHILSEENTECNIAGDH